MKKNHSHAKIFFAVLLSLFFALNLHAQAPEKCKDVMLQGFYWDSQNETKWTSLENQAEEIGAYFDLVWLPPSALSEGGVGYHPRQWSNQSSTWGSTAQLKSLIQTLNNNNCKAIADIVVNHRGGNTSWCNFMSENFGTYGSFQLTAEHICNDDEVNSASGAGSCRGTATGQSDSGEKYEAARDLDHKSTYVQNSIKAYLKWMKNEIGYSGWRYDLVKGFNGYYVGEYNDAAAGYLSVGEFWDGNYDLVKNWIDATGKRSMAFDFPGKYAALNNGLQSNNYEGMVWSGRQSGLVHSNYDRYAVTFVDNHDTYRDHNKYTGDVQKAYAFILSAPGVPCVFWPHWTANKAAIKGMISARKEMGVHSQSASSASNKGSYYESTIQGDCGSLMCRIGSWSGTPDGYTVACSGNGWAFFTKKTSENCQGVTPPDPLPAIGNITISFKAPEDWTAVKIWAWDADNNATNYSGGTWPGANMTLNNDGYYTISFTDVEASTMGVVINNGNTATDKQQTVDLTTTKDVCWVTTTSVTESGTKKYSVIEDAACGGTIDPIGEAITVKVLAPSNLGSNVYIYSWNGVDYPNAVEYTGAWPGTKMLKDNSGDFTYTFPDNLSSVYIIFTDGVSGSTGEQTDDVQDVTKSTCYQISSEKHEHMMSQKMVYTADSVDCVIITDVEEPEIKNALTIYPNPVNNELNLHTDKVITVAEIMNISGNTVKVSAGNHIDVSALPTGMYFVKVSFADDTSELCKFIKQ